MIVRLIWLFVVIFSITGGLQADRSKRDEDRLHFSGPRQSEDVESRLNHRRRPQNSGDGSYIENVFKIPIAVIKGTSAAAQAFSPQNTEYIDKIFDIPVMTLDAVGSFIKETRPQRLSNNNNDDNDDETIQRPVRPSNENRDERRRRILQEREEERRRREERRRLIEQERQRRRIMKDRERFFNLNDYPTLNFAYGLTDLLLGGHGHGSFFGGHGHGHGHGSHVKPPHRPLKPLKPSKPGHHGSHGSNNGNHESGNEGYEVTEEIDEGPIKSGIFSWLQTTAQSDDSKIQNKIAPGAEYRYDRDRPEFRYS